MTIPLFFDTETYCETPITNGTHRYAETAEIIMWQWAVGDGSVHVLDGDADTSEIIALLLDPQYEIVCHNSNFDRNVLRENGLDTPINRWFDTMACAMAHSLPGSLGALCEIVNVPMDKAKDKAGKALIQLFCKPPPKGRKVRRATRETHPVEWDRFREYGKLDVEAMRQLYEALPRWNYRGVEYELWCLDQKINDRGIAVDVDLAHAAVRAADRAKKEQDGDAVRLTSGEVTAVTQRDKMLEHILAEYGVSLPDMQTSTIERRVADEDLPLELRELLALRLQGSKTSVSKYKRVVNGMSRDGRLRGLLQFCGAGRTGRWSGRLFQPQNLARPSMENDAIERGIEALKCNAEDLA